MDQLLGSEEAQDLRRADWRFLLPRSSIGCFMHLVVLGGPSGLAGRMGEAGIARQVSDRLPKSGRIDALAVLHDSPVSLEHAAKSLAPGGVLYYEVKRRSSGNHMAVPGRVYRAMRDFGLQPTGTYLVTPDFANFRQYVPVDAPGAFSWYLMERYAPLSLPQYVVNLAMRAFRRGHHRWLAWFMPNYAVTATAGTVENDRPAILEHQAICDEFQTSPVHPVLLTNGIDDGSRVVLLPFAKDTVQPTVVLKVGRLPEFNSIIEREQQRLEEMRKHLHSSLQDSIPRPLGVSCFEGLMVGAESYAPGRSMMVLGWQWRRPMRDKLEDLQLATNWLSHFHRQQRANAAAWGKDDLLLQVEALMTEYCQAFDTTPEEDRLFAMVRAHVETLGDATVPLVLRHIDFSPINVYRDGRSLTVIDWEDRSFDRGRFGPALCDLFYFVTYWSFAAHGLHTEEAQIRNFWHLFLQLGSHGCSDDMVHRAIANYMQEQRIDRRLYPVLLFYSSIEHALERLNRQAVFGESAADARSGNLYVSHLGNLADHVDELFATPSAWQVIDARDDTRQPVRA